MKNTKIINITVFRVHKHGSVELSLEYASGEIYKFISSWDSRNHCLVLDPEDQMDEEVRAFLNLNEKVQDYLREEIPARLFAAVFGTRGGQSRSAAKQAASRLNGQKNKRVS